MPSSNVPEVIVARFLKSNQYNETLDAFLKEAGLPPDAGTTGPNDWTIEKVLEEKKQYEASLVYEKVERDDDDLGWSLPAPSKPHVISSLRSPSNILAVHVTPSTTAWAPSTDEMKPLHLLVSSADRKISVLSTDPGHELQETIYLAHNHNSPVLSIVSVSDQAFLTSSMSGHIDFLLCDDIWLSSERNHAKYAVQVIITHSRYHSWNGTPFCIAATAGWDQKICVYSFVPPTDLSSIGEDRDYNAFRTVTTISIPSNPESILFVRHPDGLELFLIVGRRDSTYLYYYRLTEEHTELYDRVEISVQEAGRQNLAPHANAWISFSPSSLAASPTDPNLIAIATSHLPHMKLILVRLLFPDAQDAAARFDGRETQASQARAELAIQDRENAAIILHVSTLAPQTPYSTPQVVWRPEGSGVWVNGDDGVIRGVEVRTGKVVASLKGHEVGSKVRSLWAGMVRVKSSSGEEGAGKEEEWLVSGGFDKEVIVWKVDNEQS